MAPKRKTPTTKASSSAISKKDPKIASLVDYESEAGSSEKELTENSPTHSQSVADGDDEEVESPKGGSEAAKEEGEEGIAEKEIRVPTKRGKKSKSTKYQIGFCIDLAWCKKENWNELLDVINKQKWSKLLCFCADEGLYEKEMDEFCEKFENHEGLVLSVVNGKIIKFDMKKLSEWFEVPMEGYKEYCKGCVKLNVDGAENNEILEFFGGSENALSIDQKHLAPIPKLLFQLVWRFLLPRPQKRTIANLMDLSLMYCLVKGISINFPGLFIAHLTHCVTRKLRVGYGSLLTYIFKKCNVKLGDEPSFELEPENYLTEKTLLSLNMRVEGGKLAYVTEGGKSKEEGGKRKRKLEEEEGEEEEVKKNEEEEKVPEKSTPETRTRKSQRIATKTVPSKETVDLEAEEEPVPLKQEAPQIPVYGFSKFAAGNSMDVLDDIKSLMVDLISKVEEVNLKVEGLEAKLHEVKHELFHHIRMNEAAVESRVEFVAATFRPPHH